ncbi:guanine nucleotide-binding protein subunit beta-like protein 1 [Hetaerina americana]|uniref:guanine nucleotide-binding protein subunit beta-like protein 1 n=1 Tax=Hetaerina americana TaxID=62018 RepID=UPI003A7F174B
MPKPPPGPLYTLKGDPSPVHSLHFWEKSRNDKLFAGCQSGQVQLWSLKTNRSVEGLQAHSGPCINVACFRDSLITQGKGDGHIKLWHSLEGGGWAPSYTIYTKHSIFCRFSILKTVEDENAMIVCPDDDHSVAVYSLNTGERFAHLNFDNFSKNSKSYGYIMALKAFNDPYTQHPMLLVAHEAGQLSLKDLSNGGKEICCLNVGEPILCLDFDPNEGTGIYGSPEGAQIKKFSIDTQTGNCQLGSLTAITNPGISSIEIRPDFKLVATGGWDGRLRIFSWQRRKKETSDVNLVEEKNECAHTLSISQDSTLNLMAPKSSFQPLEKGALIATGPAEDRGSISSEKCISSKGTNNEHVPAYRKPMKPLAVLNHHTKAIQSVVFSVGPVESWESSCLLAAGSHDGGISLWDLYN